MSEHRARKRFGQHFLHDPFVIERLLMAIAPQPQDRLVEIGPGLGALTCPLLERAGRLHVVELDRDVIPLLEQKCGGKGELEVTEIYEDDPPPTALHRVGGPAIGLPTKDWPRYRGRCMQHALTVDLADVVLEVARTGRRARR